MFMLAGIRHCVIIRAVKPEAGDRPCVTVVGGYASGAPIALDNDIEEAVALSNDGAAL